ncbi:MAG: hypothetical protein KME32_27545 [Mojavia pulchra JT2-VF2]|uniref:Uncharacterized protein n=1 Tax=Mojavia pulchra JT2-VF2 TaxID=287848 RepID=A0A951UIJ4_9NOST|nr:hypothetical protein [Mojavia pulchra JT2-VF2]
MIARESPPVGRNPTRNAIAICSDRSVTSAAFRWVMQLRGVQRNHAIA